MNMKPSSLSTLAQLGEIVSQGLCHRCGSCAGICPSAVIEPGEDYYPLWEGKEARCNDCGLCVRACPGVSFSFPEHAGRVFGKEVTVADEHGVFLRAFLGYANDPAVRESSTSGGIGTALPQYLVESGKARGAFAVVPDDARPWRPRAVIARTRRDFVRAALSKYPACSMNHLFRQIEREAGPFVFTGLPCHVHGLRKMAELNKSIGDKAALAVGLVCHSCLDHQSLRDIFDIYRIDGRGVAGVEYRGGKLPGYIRVLIGNGRWTYLPYPHLGPDRYRPNAKECLTLLFKLYSPPRCRLCIDAMSEFADISVGDPWLKGWEAEGKLRGGYSLVIARTEKGLRALEEAQRAGAITLEPVSGDRVLTSHLPMVHLKRMRGLYNLEKRRRRGDLFPEYGFGRTFGGTERIREAFRAATYLAADRPRLRRLLLRFLLSRAGRPVVGLLFFRRRVIQGILEKAKRGTRGDVS
jgi:coenzyme F420 hydrogenase subunit beta